MMSQKWYLQEVQERSSIELDDLKMEDALESPEVCVMVENAYRRGFFQGAAELLRSISEKSDTASGSRWLETVVHHWRYKNHDGAFEPPPRIAGVELGQMPSKAISKLDQSWSHARTLKRLLQKQINSEQIDDSIARSAIVLVLAELAFRDSAQSDGVGPG